MEELFNRNSGHPVVSYKADTPAVSALIGGMHNICSFKTYNATNSELFSMIGLTDAAGNNFNLTVTTFEGIPDGGPVVHRPQYAEFPNIPAHGGNTRTISTYTISNSSTELDTAAPVHSDTTFHPAGTDHATVASPPTPVLAGLNAAINQHFVVTTKYKNAAKGDEVTLQIVLNKATAEAFNATAAECKTPLELWKELLDVAPGHPLHGLEQIELLCKILTPRD